MRNGMWHKLKDGYRKFVRDTPRPTVYEFSSSLASASERPRTVRRDGCDWINLNRSRHRSWLRSGDTRFRSLFAWACDDRGAVWHSCGMAGSSWGSDQTNLEAVSASAFAPIRHLISGWRQWTLG